MLVRDSCKAPALLEWPRNSHFKTLYTRYSSSGIIFKEMKIF